MDVIFPRNETLEPSNREQLNVGDVSCDVAEDQRTVLFNLEGFSFRHHRVVAVLATISSQRAIKEEVRQTQSTNWAKWTGLNLRC